MRRLVALFIVLLLDAGRSSAQVVPDAGLAAESAGRWDDAVRVYQELLVREPARFDLWIRIADIEARRGRSEAAIGALEQAVRGAPANPTLHHRLSQAYAEAGRPDAALKAIDAALALQPNDAAYLRSSATLATWSGAYQEAAQRYRQLGKLSPADADTTLNLARVSAWSGETDAAVDAYRRYLAMHGEAADVWLELARAESWRGNYGAAQEALNAYSERFGTTEAYSRELASVLARGGRPSRAMGLLEPLLARDPTSYDLRVIRTIALAEQGRPRETFEALDTVRRLNPTSRETQSAERLVRTRLGSSVQPGLSFYTDSDQLTIQRYSPSATMLLASGTQLTVGYDHAILDAPTRSGLARLTADSSIYDSGWASVAQKLGAVTFEGRAGSATADAHRLTVYAVGARVRSDVLNISAEQSSDFLLISPRTLDLGLTQRRDRVAVDWDASARYHVTGEVVYQAISDGNARWEFALTPRRAFARTDWLNLDLGASIYTLSATRDLPNGYYDPRRYERYTAVAFPYFKVTENVGVALSLAGGVQRDDPASTFRFGGNAAADLTLGIYQPWALKIGASVTNNRRETGAFSGYGGSIVLTRRF